MQRAAMGVCLLLLWTHCKSSPSGGALPPASAKPSKATTAAPSLDASHQWAAWRGPQGTGVAPHGTPPVRWAEGQNIRWKAALPGLGHSTPIVWGDRIYLTTAIPHGEALASGGRHADGAHDNMPAYQRQRFAVLAIDRKDGSVAWQTTLRDEQPHEGTHRTGSWASASAVTDGKRVYAFFGSRGLFALDLAGSVLWRVDFGPMQTKHAHGEGSSPALFGDTIVVNWDHDGEDALVAFDTATGGGRWRTPRDEVTSWSSPLIVDLGETQQVIVSATGRVRGYDLATGKLIWECGGMSGNVVATPVHADGVVYVASSYEKRAMLAIRLADARGDITGTPAVVWSRRHDTPYVSSPVLVDGTLCFLRHLSGMLTCVDARTGSTLHGPRKLSGLRRVFASPAAADGRIYVPSREGLTAVLQGTEPFELLAVNRLDDTFTASPALVGSKIYLRGEKHLYAIARSRDSKIP